ncbi:MAG TPA: hypothetical protein PKD20_01665 [Candidatus Saccharibacteria bacterium]|jgi:hypothetical protein|nr:hypothetical protein [Candidatus Saccharibacteria bacterium]HMT55565.1 hypothetical protein [Candidatus Saccharibacteria bacterium]
MVLSEANLLPSVQEKLDESQRGYLLWKQKIVAPECQLACGFPIWHAEQQISGLVTIEPDETPGIEDSFTFSIESLMLPLGGIILRNNAGDIDIFQTDTFRKIAVRNGKNHVPQIRLSNCRGDLWKPEIPHDKIDSIVMHLLDLAQRGSLSDQKQIHCN